MSKIILPIFVAVFFSGLMLGTFVLSKIIIDDIENSKFGDIGLPSIDKPLDLQKDDEDYGFGIVENTLEYYSENKTNVFISNMNHTEKFVSEQQPDLDSHLVIIKTESGEYPIIPSYYPLKIPYGDDITINVETWTVKCGKGITVLNSDYEKSFFSNIEWSENETDIKNQLPQRYENYTTEKGLQWAKNACDSIQQETKLLINNEWFNVVNYWTWSTSTNGVLTDSGVTIQDE